MPGLCPGHPRLYNHPAKRMDGRVSPAMTEILNHDSPCRYAHRTDRDPDVVAAVGADGRHGENSRVPARRHDVCDRRGGGVRELPVPALRLRRIEAAAGRLGRRRRRPVRLSRAVFPRASLRAAGRSGPVELSLAAPDRAVLLAAARRAAGAASHHRRVARARRNGAAVRRQWRRALRRARCRDWPQPSSPPSCGRPIR